MIASSRLPLRPDVLVVTPAAKIEYMQVAFIVNSCFELSLRPSQSRRSIIGPNQLNPSRSPIDLGNHGT
jgi:hypothetical protein